MLIGDVAQMVERSLNTARGTGIDAQHLQSRNKYGWLLFNFYRYEKHTNLKHKYKIDIIQNVK